MARVCLLSIALIPICTMLLNAQLVAEILKTEGQINDLDKAIETEEYRIETDENSAENSFVTFKTRFSATVTGQCLLENNISEWNTYLAPAPSDVVWKNMLYNSRSRSLINIKINLLRAAMGKIVITLGP